ncbi:NAD-dependent deacylase [Carboxylicivirga sp. M1479]|uniref:SIR2 family NAD-dependent protein deacylase n=1 Tax=Carboxylicivirga sp. M1479 TaxID=2594476 RepID=UPI001177ED6D|nr:NAD-dependent deacylase [Carboxylicivirga sp. M1479]TRX71598.1 NAD-dependent deacylase [Carboxylicivirga sp. M1479]
MSKKKLAVLTGAGISAESGIKTFRDNNGLWENHDVMEVASPEAWARDPHLVLEFYNQRRKQLLECSPNEGHHGLVALEEMFDVQIITQNVDDLHEQAGSSQVLHLHGELKKVRSTKDESLVYTLDGWELKWGDTCEKGAQLRPHIVWFGEAVPAIETAITLVEQADILVVIGTSLNVYPAAGLLNYAKAGTPIYIIDPNQPVYTANENITFINDNGTVGVPKLINLLSNSSYV